MAPPSPRCAVRLLSTPRVEPGVPAAVQRVLERELHVPPDSPLLVSLSGGVDSVALFRVLLALSPRWRWRLHAVHFNHGLRAEADSDEAFVRELADNHSVPLHVRRLPQDTYTPGASGMQERTRKWRRAESLAILRELEAHGDGTSNDGMPSAASSDEEAGGGGACEKDSSGSGSASRPMVGGQDGAGGGSGAWSGVGSIALGHHADDQVETVLLKALRGCHLANLRGMAWRDGPFVRPLLAVRKAALTDYLGGLGQGWVEDASNADDSKYKRNKVRLQLVPLLEELAGGGDALVARVSAVEAQSSQLHAWLQGSAASYLADEPEPRKLRVQRLIEQPALLQEELLHQLVRSVHADASASALSSLSSSDGADGGGDGGEGGGGTAPAAAAVKYSALRHALRQLAQPGATRWSLDVTRDVRLNRQGKWLYAEPLEPRK